MKALDPLRPGVTGSCDLPAVGTASCALTSSPTPLSFVKTETQYVAQALRSLCLSLLRAECWRYRHLLLRLGFFSALCKPLSGRAPPSARDVYLG